MDEIIGQYTCYTVALERDDDAYSRAPPLRSGATHKDGYQTTEGGCYIDARDLKRLIAAGETQFLEIKPGNEKPSELATSLAAFANATGGTLVLGAVERASGYEIEGVGDPKLALDHLYSAAALCSPTLDLLPPERVDIDGRDVFVATVPDDRRNAYSVDGRYQVRRGTFRRPLDSDEILALLSSRGRYAYDATIVPGAHRDHLDGRLVDAFAARFPSGSTMETTALLEARGLLARPNGDRAVEPVPMVAGLLLLGSYPQQFFPHARIAVVRYAGATMGERFLARELDGPIMAQLDAAEAWLVTNTQRTTILHGLDRTDVDEYPRPVLRELVLNALAHRDYLLGGDRIRIYLFGTDRLEIHSPGRLPGPMTLDTLLTQRWSRNRTLVQALVALTVMEELGYGLDRVTDALAAAELPPPSFQQTDGTFVVTVRGHGTGLLAQPGNATTLTAPTDNPTLPMITPAMPIQRRTRDERQAWILDRLRLVGPLDMRAVASALGVSPDTVLRDLRDLTTRGLIIGEGNTNNRRYRLRTDDASDVR